MPLSFAHSIFQRLSAVRPPLLYAAIWTVLLMAMVAVASFATEISFVSAVSPSSSFSRSCNAGGLFIRIPMDVPGEMLCVPAKLVKRSVFDFLVPTIFAATVVAGSVCVLRSLCLWEDSV
ncbi:uncharacterized protein LOC132310259 [Cornus florida]|uniref:uncharacterized protein LOC132310259 n=1 Tax=Cornus florida TaxID=4283 RepID=UPI00289EB1F7|nr:uncharacterized protein LOC132310259 [Cornus florida]